MRRFLTKTRLVLGGLVLALSAASLMGCRAEECQQMSECCEAVAGEPGVGSACGEMAEQTRDPDTCRTILRTVRFMYEERAESAPPACTPADEQTKPEKPESSSRYEMAPFHELGMEFYPPTGRLDARKENG